MATNLQNFDAENADNLPEIEKQWAVKATHHAETYWKLITSIPGSKLRLTPCDDEIYAAFLVTFPNFNIKNIDEDYFKSEKSKAKWREFHRGLENKVEDHNFGTLLRKRYDGEYGPDNGLFATRLQFYAIEIARNKQGLNDMHCKKN
ncbi:DUF757-domain-containing protein [Neocallimastix lanati (nom. inval.)]|uniref:DUF757-domain-containing protein n=1 Tax=Neocallimastix californiae TaxID=1754190 RepID=A0A1Y2AJZ4_9FUNG|nr:DUF757-domain-containing protein [Neocallimastix sp. JGI-2020a]ORY22871.1 DUF757-domain-containing protein [Neocallimastix californiae]|eukprot:ORY22871.1 DUF757-domain-containing protein [Neocallimastix californiae]